MGRQTFFFSRRLRAFFFSGSLRASSVLLLVRFLQPTVWNAEPLVVWVPLSVESHQSLEQCWNDFDPIDMTYLRVAGGDVGIERFWVPRSI
jgi:hypothetical protein